MHFFTNAGVKTCNNSNTNLLSEGFYPLKLSTAESALLHAGLASRQSTECFYREQECSTLNSGLGLALHSHPYMCIMRTKCE